MRSSYEPQLEDVWHLLKAEVTIEVKGNLYKEQAITKYVLPTPVAPRLRRYCVSGVPHAIESAQRTHTAPVPIRNIADTLRILTFNTLAEIYATRSVYPYCPSWAMSWAYRGQLVMQEMLSYDADILCLQEVQADHFKSQLLPQMRERGYDGLHKMKTRESMGVEGKVDGCAVFYKKSRFTVNQKYCIEFNEALKHSPELVRVQLPP